MEILPSISIRNGGCRLILQLLDSYRHSFQAYVSVLRIIVQSLRPVELPDVDLGGGTIVGA